jgi:uncharacterized protein
MKAKRVVWTLLFLLLGVAAFQLPAQQSEAVRKRFEEIKAKAEKGEAEAQCNLGSCYYSGEGVARDAAEAVKWYRKAAEQGHAAGQYYLGSCCFSGEGVTREAAEGVKWFRKAAEQGHAEAQCNLGVCYCRGEGVPKDYVEAYKWASLAWYQDLDDAEELVAVLGETMTSEQIAEGQRLAGEFKPHKTPEAGAPPSGQPPKP